MSRAEVSKGVIEQIIEGDDDDRRFEKFAADLFSLRDGFHYETTAPTGDLATDARARTTLAAGELRVCCTTQSAGHKSKALGEIDRIITTSGKIARLHICFSKDVREKTLVEIREYAQSRLPNAEVDVHGQSGLVDLAFRYQPAFLDNYARDLDEQALWHQIKADDDGGEKNQVNLMRVALTTVFHPEMVAQRKLITDTLVVTALADGSAKSLNELTVAVAAGLKLLHPPTDASLVSAVGSLKEKNLVKETHRGISLTDAGFLFRDRLLAEGARSSLDGRSSFKSLLGSLPASSLSADEFSRAWKAIQQRLSKAFLNNGLRVITELQSIAQNESAKGDSAPEMNILNYTVQNILGDIEALRLHDVAGRRIAAVLREMLCDKSSAAFRWISELGVKYVVICTLGLDPELERRIRERIASWILIPDTHVVLSYLCEGDEGHAACAAILKQLDRLDCPIWEMDSVLEEAANHAEIADGCYHDWCERVRLTRAEFPDVKPADVLQTTDNAFVKGFACAAGCQIGKTYWYEYIGQFRGTAHLDVFPLAETLRQELRARHLKDDDSVRTVGKAFMMAKLRPDRNDVDENSTMRCEWDGRLLASALSNRMKEPPGRRVIIMSDSDRLRRCFYEGVAAEKRHGLKISDPAAVACGLAFVPGTFVNLECVRHFLFSGSVTFPDGMRSHELLMNAFLKSAKLLRQSALGDRVEEAIMGGGSAPQDS